MMAGIARHFESSGLENPARQARPPGRTKPSSRSPALIQTSKRHVFLRGNSKLGSMYDAGP
jgi:hypothetical protein